MPFVLYILGAVSVGMLVAVQPPMNAILARQIGTAVGATVINIGVGFTLAAGFLLLTGRGQMSAATLMSVPWWIYLAGVFGALFVAAGVVIAPVTGALLFFVCVVAGQLIGSTLADHLGAFGLTVREVTPLRLGGLAFVLLGAIMVQKG